MLFSLTLFSKQVRIFACATVLAALLFPTTLPATKKRRNRRNVKREQITAGKQHPARAVAQEREQAQKVASAELKTFLDDIQPKIVYSFLPRFLMSQETRQERLDFLNQRKKVRHLLSAFDQNTFNELHQSLEGGFKCMKAQSRLDLKKLVVCEPTEEEKKQLYRFIYANPSHISAIDLVCPTPQGICALVEYLPQMPQEGNCHFRGALKITDLSNYVFFDPLLRIDGIEELIVDFPNKTQATPPIPHPPQGALAHLTKLHLSDCGLDWGHFLLPHLTDLTLKNCYLSKQGLHFVEQSNALKSVEVCNTPLDKVALTHLIQKPLRSLQCSYSLTPEAAKALCEAEMPPVEDLLLIEPALTGQTLDCLISMTALAKIVLSHITLDENAINAFIHNANISALLWSDLTFTRPAIEHLNRPDVHFQNLAILMIKQCTLLDGTPLEIQHFSFIQKHAVATLALCNMPLDDDIIGYINVDRLRSLILSGLRITGAGINTLCSKLEAVEENAAYEHALLESLDCANNPIRRDGVVRLRDMARKPFFANTLIIADCLALSVSEMGILHQDKPEKMLISGGCFMEDAVDATAEPDTHTAAETDTAEHTETPGAPTAEAAHTNASDGTPAEEAQSTPPLACAASKSTEG